MTKQEKAAFIKALKGLRASTQAFAAILEADEAKASKADEKKAPAKKAESSKAPEKKAPVKSSAGAKVNKGHFWLRIENNDFGKSQVRAISDYCIKNNLDYYGMKVLDGFLNVNYRKNDKLKALLDSTVAVANTAGVLCEVKEYDKF